VADYRSKNGALLALMHHFWCIREEMQTRQEIRVTPSLWVCIYSVRLVQCELEPLPNRDLVGQIGSFAYAELRKINRLAGAARVDIAGVASSILATPTIFS
jgi:hypothetical protein